ncbi:PIR Superfamily Protein [Plasmodium ovale wallikeri]|uniref:PIR Superfamily Protein n=1 Tax=Plasmodium ovale wallikeri TaxID=864142 RepID=A0A1A9AFS8_PLAOA|nr:PIR Superfamily Protein [Plasmodium ovale wallikeri]SBT58222.1 PIR Superfamily Protein [Plasmodium ovale wallikeri]
MSENIVDKARALLKQESIYQRNSDLPRFNGMFSDVIKDALGNYKNCKEEKKKNPNRNVICQIDKDIEQSLGKNLEEFKTHATQDKRYCDQLLSWMLDNIEYCKSDIYCISWLYSKFEKFWEDSTCKSRKNDECNKKFIKEFDMNSLKSKRELCLFLEHYDKNENILNGAESKRKKIYCMYVKYMFDLYHFMDDEAVHSKYDMELEHFKKFFGNSDRITKLKRACGYPNLSVTSNRKEYNRNFSSELSIERFTPKTTDLTKSREEALKGMDSILKEEVSHKLYNEFDKKDDNSKIKEFCEKHFKEEKTYSKESIELCKKIVKNFNELYTFESTLNSNERCLHYKYWVYGELWKMIQTKSYHDHVKDIINKFMDLQNEKIVSSDDTKTFCHYYFVFKDLLELNLKLEEKDLHDYFKYYDTLEKKIPSDISNKEKYRKYLDYISILHTRHKIGWDCCDELYGVDPLCRHYFKCEDEYNPSYLLSVLKGKPEEYYKQKKEKFPVVIFGEAELTNNLKEDDVMRIQYGRCTNVYDPEDKKKIFGRRCDYRASPDHFDKIHSKLTNPKNKDAPKVTISISSLPVNQNNPSDISNTEAHESNPSQFKIGTSVALALGGILISFLYYKFTPFGSLFRKRGQGKTKFEEDFNEEYMQEFPYDSEYEDVNMHNRRIHIAYQ